MSLMDSIEKMERELAALRARVERMEGALRVLLPLDLCPSCGVRTYARVPADAATDQFRGIAPDTHVMWCFACTFWKIAPPIDLEALAEKMERKPD